MPKKHTLCCQILSLDKMKLCFFSVLQRFSNGALQGLARCATLAFRKFTTCFLHYSLFSEIYKIGYDDYLEVVRYPTLFLACCSKKKKKKKKKKNRD